MDERADDAPAAEDAAVPDPDRDMPNRAAMDNWDRVVADMEAVAAEYEQQGWDTLQVHPGDVAVVGEDEPDGPGFDVLVPDDEYEALADVFGSGDDVDEEEVYRASVEGMTYLVVALRHAAGTAVFVPVYYRTGDGDVEAAFRAAEEGGDLRTRLRTLTGDRIVVSHGDPDLFRPDLDGA